MTKRGQPPSNVSASVSLRQSTRKIITKSWEILRWKNFRTNLISLCRCQYFKISVCLIWKNWYKGLICRHIRSTIKYLVKETLQILSISFRKGLLKFLVAVTNVRRTPSSARISLVRLATTKLWKPIPFKKNQFKPTFVFQLATWARSLD